METTLGASCSSRKRKQPDEDEVLLLKGGPLREQPVENEYEHLDDDDDPEDEEEIANKKRAEYEQMLRAQEPATIAQYDDIKITPFNLEDELEDGEFDKAGNFIFRREETDEEKNDTWAESVDWAAVEQRERERKQQQSTSDKPQDSGGDLPEPVIDRIDCFKKMLRIMRPDETVQKTIRRLGNSVPKRRPMKGKDKSNAKDLNPSDEATITEARRVLDLMIELAHQRLEDGDTDIYQKSFEDLEDAIN